MIVTLFLYFMASALLAWQVRSKKRIHRSALLSQQHSNRAFDRDVHAMVVFRGGEHTPLIFFRLRMLSSGVGACC